jgi:hypothetical protein
MYWYKPTKSLRLILAGTLVTFFCACKPEIKETGGSLKYFDLKGYFNADSARLTKLNKPVLKTVQHNGVAESKKVLIKNWGAELSLFIGSDINKPAWKDSYKITSTTTTLIYQAKEPDLLTREIIINKTGTDKVKWIMIINHAKNMLYETKEKLIYFPDSLYKIEKLQKVRLMGDNRYDVTGSFN